MSKSILKLHVDERDNISVRVSQDVQVLTCEEADRIEDEYKRMQADNESLRELCAGLLTGYECGYGELCKGCTWDGIGDSKTFSCLPRAKARELGVEVSE